MADPKVEAAADEKEFETAVAGEDGENEDLYDKDGKPLPWNKSPRFRKLYGEAKSAREADKVMKEYGLGLKDVKGLIEEYATFRTEYDEWKEKQAKGKTTPKQDDAMEEELAEQEKAKKLLKKLGVKFEDPEEDKKQAKAAEDKRMNQIGAAWDTMASLAEEAGYDMESMEPAQRIKLLKKIDFFVSEYLDEDAEARNSFMRGSLKPIEKYAKKVLADLGKPIKKADEIKGSGINKLPPRVGSRIPGKVTQAGDTTGPAKSIKDATEQMVADLKAAKAAKKEE